jgi:hypothetical protein
MMEQEEPCEVCGKPIKDCACSECPLCGQIGDLDCYREVDLGICGGLYTGNNETKQEEPNP